MVQTKLGEITDLLKTGKTPPSKKSEYFNGNVNWYTPGDFGSNKELNGSNRTITQLAVDDNKAVIFPKNTLLVTCIGDIGKIGITKKISSSNQQITAIKPKKEVDVNYLYYWFLRNKSRLENTANNAVVPILNNGTLKKIDFSYPPLKTQQKIAAILDEADRLRQLDKKLIQKYEDLSQSLFLEMFGDPVSNPKNFKEIPLRSLTLKIGSGSTPKGGKQAYISEGISLIRSLNIHNNRFKYKNLAFINDKQAKKLSNVVVEESDVLFNITGASVCRTAIVPENVLPARVNQHVSILRPMKDTLDSIFLCHLLISDNFQNKLEDLASKGGATRQAINKSQLEELIIPVPEIERQRKFSKSIVEIEKQRKKMKKSLNKSEELFNSLLQKAFKGELV